MFAYVLIALAVLAVAFYFARDFLIVRATEGFESLNVPADLFVPKVVPGGADEISRLSPGAAMNAATEKLVGDFVQPATVGEAESRWATMTSERCYRSDIGESLKKTRNFLQRTNNYARSHPDSCSAPNHEFVGTFYNPYDGVGMKPGSGLPYPAGAMLPAGKEETEQAVWDKGR
jgi:hypothetical protein